MKEVYNGEKSMLEINLCSRIRKEGGVWKASGAWGFDGRGGGMYGRGE